MVSTYRAVYATHDLRHGVQFTPENCWPGLRVESRASARKVLDLMNCTMHPILCDPVLS